MPQQNIIIDFHTHAFPDKVASSAIPALEKIGGVTANHDGKVNSLLVSMDRAGISASVLCSIATRPSQFAPILAWSKAIRSDRIIPLPSCHPADPQYLAQIEQIKGEGFKGIKMHPYYQEFFLDDERLYPFYEKVCKEELLLLMHTGFDIGFPRDRRADPQRISRILARFPELTLICSHLGAWEQWDEVADLLIGKQIYMDISFSLHMLPREKAKDMLERHPPNYILFGSDSPWADQKSAIEQVKALDLSPERQQALLGDNATRLLSV